MNQSNSLYLIWKNPNTSRYFTVGRLEKDETGYLFEYCDEYQLAVDSGWKNWKRFR